MASNSKGRIRRPQSAPFHLSIYRARPDIKAIIHAHPSALVSFSICGQVPDTRVFPEAWNVCGQVAFAPYALPGSEQLGTNIAAQFAASEGDTLCVVLENHGVVVGGASLSDVFKRFETLSSPPRLFYRPKTSAGGFACSTMPAWPWPKIAYLPCPLARRSPPAVASASCARRSCDFMHRAYEHNLVTSTWGSLSARIDADAFWSRLTASTGKLLDLEDLIVVRGGKCPAGVSPVAPPTYMERSTPAHPEMNAVINALPVSATAFSVSEAVLDTRTIPESFLFLKDVPKLAFETLHSEPKAVAQAMGPDNPVALLEHNGALVAGKTVLDAFDRLEVLEATAEAIIQSKPLGTITPMDDAVIDELLEAFGRV